MLVNIAGRDFTGVTARALHTDESKLLQMQLANGASPPSDLREVVDLPADAIPQHDEHRHRHLHVALLGVVAEHLLDDGAEEAGGQVRTEQRLRDGDEREGLDGREAGDLGLVAADVRRVGLVLLQVVRRRRVVHDLVSQLEGLARQQVLLLFC